MKRAQLLGVAIAGICGLGAFFGVMKLVNKPPTIVTQEVTTNMAQVLVAKTEIGLGQITGPENFRWQDWPQAAVSPSYIQRGVRPNAISDLSGAVARTPMLPGEPITCLQARQGRRRRRACRHPCRPACAPSPPASRKRRASAG